jgi:hypothetical protein
LGVTVHEALPLHVSVLQASSVQVIGVPPQVPAAHTSSCVQASPSSHAEPSARGVSVQVAVPLHVRISHGPSEQVTVVPAHFPAAHASPYVQALASSQVVPSALGVTVQTDVPLHVRVLHESSVHAIEIPPQVPPAHLSL